MAGEARAVGRPGHVGRAVEIGIREAPSSSPFSFPFFCFCPIVSFSFPTSSALLGEGRDEGGGGGGGGAEENALRSAGGMSSPSISSTSSVRYSERGTADRLSDAQEEEEEEEEEEEDLVELYSLASIENDERHWPSRFPSLAPRGGEEEGVKDGGGVVR